MKKRMIIGLLLLATAALFSPQELFADDDLSVQISLSTNEAEQGGDVTVTVTVSTTNAQSRQFRIGSFAESFGVYILGPWGPVEPDLKKVRPENWMHGEHSASTLVTFEKGKPFTTTFILSDYFRTGEPTKQVPGVIDGLLPGEHQMNIKFLVYDLGMTQPIDSGPVLFMVKKDLRTRASSVRGDPRR